ncbi:MAG: PEP/pyruvate-binding domain-containing protein, partial [bacterium]
MEYILKLSAIEENERLPLKVGGKAYNLALLAKRGFNIPNGFVITTDAYFEFIRYNSFDKTIKQMLAKTTMENLAIQSTLLKEKLLSGELPTFIKEKVWRQISQLTSPFYAVRSSAPGEDSLSSTFAGIYDSYLGIDKGNLFEAIKKCL